MTRPLVIAHRGHSARHPENTLEAYRAAIAAGADLVELDARQARDGVVVACHDPTLARLAGRDDAIADLSSSELVSLTLSNGGRIVPLTEALGAICAHRQALIDVKTQDSAIVEAVVAAVQTAARRERVWIGVRDPEQVALARRLLPGVRVLAFLPEGADATIFQVAGASAFRVWEGGLDQPAASRLFGRLRVWVTAGGAGTGREVGDVDAAGLEAILQRKPEAVLLNDPDLLIAQAQIASW